MRFKEFLTEADKTKWSELLTKLNNNEPGSDDILNCNYIKSLKDINFTGFKKNIGLSIYNNNLIKNLDGGPKVLRGTLFLGDNENFESFTGTIEEIYPHEGYVEAINVDSGNNKLTSLKDIHKYIKGIYGQFSCNAPIESHVLGLLKIKGLDYFWMPNKKACDIINKYLPEGDILECQSELIDAGLKEYAKL